MAKKKINDDVSRILLTMAENALIIGEDYESKEWVKSTGTLPYSITNPILKVMNKVSQHHSDLLVTLHTIVREFARQDRACYVVALRDQGVDHNCYFNIRVKEWYERNDWRSRRYYYKKIFIIEYNLITKDNMRPEDEYHIGKYRITVKDATGLIPKTDPDTDPRSS